MLLTECGRLSLQTAETRPASALSVCLLALADLDVAEPSALPLARGRGEALHHLRPTHRHLQVPPWPT